MSEKEKQNNEYQNNGNRNMENPDKQKRNNENENNKNWNEENRMSGSISRLHAGTDTEADWEWLCSIPGIYHGHQEILLRAFGCPEAVRKASDDELALLCKKGCGWAEKVIQFRRKNSFDKIMNSRAERGIQFISHTHTMFPKRLKMISGCPYGLFIRGSLPEEQKRAVAIVGARMCTRDGKSLAEQLAQKVAEAGGVVISGAAYGIDGAAQWAALEAGGKSYALLGCGADICYPSSHRRLLDRLCENGGVISELPCGTMPLRWHFPMRNRLISGLSDVVTVIEAKKRSGSLITAEFAAEQGRQVMAAPGRPGDELSEGCNELIAQGADLILSAESFAEVVFPDYQIGRKKFSENLILAPAEKLVYSSLGLHPKSLWQLQEGTALSMGDLSESLWSLEQKGLIKETEWNYFMKMK